MSCYFSLFLCLKVVLIISFFHLSKIIEIFHSCEGHSRVSFTRKEICLSICYSLPSQFQGLYSHSNCTITPAFSLAHVIPSHPICTLLLRFIYWCLLSSDSSFILPLSAPSSSSGLPEIELKIFPIPVYALKCRINCIPSYFSQTGSSAHHVTNYCNVFWKEVKINTFLPFQAGLEEFIHFMLFFKKAQFGWSKVMHILCQRCVFHIGPA